MATTQPDRLDRIEYVLAELAERQNHTQQQIDALTVRQDRTQQQIDALTVRQDRTQQQIDALTVRQDYTQQQLDQSQQRLDALTSGYADEQQRRLQFRADFEASIADLVSQQVTLSLELQTLTANVNAHIAQTTSFLAAEQRDRAEFRSAMIGLQTETRNILQELARLRRQQQNGNSDG